MFSYVLLPLFVFSLQFKMDEHTKLIIAEHTTLINTETQLSAIRKDMAVFHDYHNTPCKFGVSGGILYKSWRILSGVQRSIYGENREIVCNYIIHKCNTLKNVHDIAFKYVNKNEFRRQALILLADCKELSSQWLRGVRIIENEYPNDESVSKYVNDMRTILEQVKTSVID